MTKAATAGVNASISALMTGQLHWFISGQSADHSVFRDAAVILQLVVGLILMIQASLQHERLTHIPVRARGLLAVITRNDLRARNRDHSSE